MQHLIEERGRNAKLIDWLDEITGDWRWQIAVIGGACLEYQLSRKF